MSSSATFSRHFISNMLDEECSENVITAMTFEKELSSHGSLASVCDADYISDFWKVLSTTEISSVPEARYIYIYISAADYITVLAGIDKIDTRDAFGSKFSYPFALHNFITHFINGHWFLLDRRIVQIDR